MKKTMDNLVSRSELLKKVNEFRSNFEARPLMYGGTLDGIETVWHMIRWAEYLISGELDDKLSDRAYSKIRHKYKCGNLGLGSTTKHEAAEQGWNDMKAASVLLLRLKEVEKLETKWRKEVDEYHFEVFLESGKPIEQARWIGICYEFPYLSFVAKNTSDYGNALRGIKSMVAEMIYELRKNKEPIPIVVADD